MADIDPNFTCSNPDLSRTNVTPEVWKILSEGKLHEDSITAVAVCQVLIVAIGIPWNAIVLASIVFHRRYKDPTYILLMNLVVTDLLVCMCVLPFNIQSAFAREFTLGSSDKTRCQVCQTIVITIVILVFTSLFTLALMSIDRLMYIKWPMYYKKYVTHKMVAVLLCIIWILCVLASIPPVFGLGEIKFANILSSCSLFTVGRTQVADNILYIMVLVVVGALPFMTTLIANIWLLLLLCRNMDTRHKRHVDNNRHTFESSKTKSIIERNLTASYHREQIQLAYVFGAIFAANVITWLPTILISMAATAVGTENVPEPTYAFVYVSYVCQPAIHPVLETCLVGKARSTIFKTMCCFLRRMKKKSADVSANHTDRTSQGNV